MVFLIDLTLSNEEGCLYIWNWFLAVYLDLALFDSYLDIEIWLAFDQELFNLRNLLLIFGDSNVVRLDGLF